MEVTKNSLKMSISGVRGIVGESMTVEVARDFGYAYGKYLGGVGKVVVGRDSRSSGSELKDAVFTGLANAGIKEIIDLDIVTTPTVQIMVKEKEANGGIMISASHNPIEWNGLKFISHDGIFLTENEVNKFFDIYNNLEKVEYKEEVFNRYFLDSASKLHTQKIIDALQPIRQLTDHKNIKVVVDCCSGSGGIADPIFFEMLGYKSPLRPSDTSPQQGQEGNSKNQGSAKLINEKPDGDFKRIPEPLPENLGMLCDAVKEHNADIGFAQDPDADRLAIVNEKGEPIGEEYTMVLCAKYILSKFTKEELQNKKIVTNLSTSRMIDDIADEFGVEVVRTKIGEVYVSEKMKEISAIFGGEGNGGVIWPAVGLGRDSLVGMAIILELMSETGKKVSELVAEITSYVVVKTKKEVANRDEVNKILNKVKEIYKGENGEKIDETDGVKVIFNNGWLHVRASNTEPIVRFYAEAPSKDIAQGWIDKVY